MNFLILLILFFSNSRIWEQRLSIFRGIINEAEEVSEMYATIRGDKLLQQRKISIYEPIAFNKVYTAWKSKKRNLVLEITGNELKTYNIYRNNIIGRKLFSENPNAGDRWIIFFAFF